MAGTRTVAGVSDGDTIYRAASAIRTALVGRKMVRFDAPRLVGKPPVAGRTIEHVRSHGKDLDVVFDDSVVLHTRLRLSGAWHLYHRDERWRRSYQQMRAAIETEDWLAVCFNAPVVETYTLPDRRRHPGMGSLGPDLGRHGTDRARCIDLVLSYPDGGTTLAEMMFDERVMCGVGNVYRSEALWVCELSPWAPVGALSQAEAQMLVNAAHRLVRANLHHAERVVTANVKGGLAVYGRTMQQCVRCRESIEEVQHGDPHRMVYWCPGCQLRHDPSAHTVDTREMDRHPAAVKYLRQLPWRRAV